VLEEFWRADPVPGAGLWLPAAVLHLRDPGRFTPWGEAVRQGYALLDDSAGPGEPAAVRYRLFNEGVARPREPHPGHPLEAPALPAALAAAEGDRQVGGRKARAPSRFRGFCGDTFRFLADLGGDNRRGWMDAQRDRYRFAVREPLVELCRALA